MNINMFTIKGQYLTCATYEKCAGIGNVHGSVYNQTSLPCGTLHLLQDYIGRARHNAPPPWPCFYIKTNKNILADAHTHAVFTHTHTHMHIYMGLSQMFRDHMDLTCVTLSQIDRARIYHGTGAKSITYIVYRFYIEDNISMLLSNGVIFAIPHHVAASADSYCCWLRVKTPSIH